jgi:Amt family ammonium transporter
MSYIDSIIIENQAELTNAIDTVWVALCAALIFFMEGGFALLESGFVRSKNAMSIIAKVFIDIIFGGIIFYIVGFGIAYGSSNGWFAFDIGISENDLGLGLTVSNQLFWFIQLGFAVAAISIVSGALAERMKLWSYTILVLVFCGIMYPMVANWVWNPSGWLSVIGFNDFAGSAAVHAMGGFSALAAAIVLGPRLGKYTADGKVVPIQGSNLALATLGTFILWLGWFGFNGGSQLAMGSVGDVADVSRIFANTNAAAAGGAVAALILTQLLYSKPDLTMILNGALAGLVSITAEPLTPSLGAATIIGAIGGLIVVFSVPFLDKLKIDDVVGAIPVHLFAGIWGTIAVVFTNGDASLGTQLYSIIVVGIFVTVASAIVWFVLKATTGIRVAEEDEINGLDMSELGMDAYPEFSKS